MITFDFLKIYTNTSNTTSLVMHGFQVITQSSIRQPFTYKLHKITDIYAVTHRG